jgi:transcriptional regulator of acetoin/glycerol metabolism
MRLLFLDEWRRIPLVRRQRYCASSSAWRCARSRSRLEHVDVQVVAATNRDLESMVASPGVPWRHAYRLNRSDRAADASPPAPISPDRPQLMQRIARSVHHRRGDQELGHARGTAISAS